MKLIHRPISFFFLMGLLLSGFSFGQIGQTLQISTRLHSFVGAPSLTLIIRDVDNNQTIPYIFDITRSDHFWMVFTGSRNYLITASTLQFSPYRQDPYCSKKVYNFCGLESHGRIIRGESLYLVISGDLTPYAHTYRCQISRHKENIGL